MMRRLQKIRNSSLERHVHAEPYVALVVSGGYEEAGDNGRFEVNAGDVVFHDRFEAHLNRFGEKGATVLNLPVPVGMAYAAGIATVTDPDRVVRAAEKSWRSAVDLLFSTAIIRTSPVRDWPDELAATLRKCPALKLSDWREEKGLAAWTVSRGFARVFGISPEAFRARVRVQRALKSIQLTQAPLAMIAAELGFADQAHMTRSMWQLTGTTPHAWRRCNWIQDAKKPGR